RIAAIVAGLICRVVMLRPLRGLERKLRPSDDDTCPAQRKGQHSCRDAAIAPLSAELRGMHGSACAGPIDGDRWRPVTSGKMLSPFERSLRPTAPPDPPEPPPSLLAFLWHFARQAKWLFAALFVVELLVALSDSAVPWFIGRVVTLVSKTPPERLFAHRGRWIRCIALVGPVGC